MTNVGLPGWRVDELTIDDLAHASAPLAVDKLSITGRATHPPSGQILT
jgi:hypothetical protein